MRILLAIFLLSATSAFAQNQVRGRIIDEAGAPLSYTTVVLLTPQDSTLQFFAVSKQDGTYYIKNIKNGKYLMQYSFTSMETIYKQVQFPLGVEDLGDQVMLPSLLEEVIIQAELVPIVFKTDTLEFNTKAFQTRPGASVEELLEKLPGVDVDEAGNIQAQGEDVTKVLVDGKEFFGNDPKVATKNLPAKALDKVQVFDRKSEESVFSGIDDGNRDKTINLVLNEDHKQGYFGKVEGGVGTEETYKAEGRVYRFSKTAQIALLGMANNINQFGFTHKGNSEFGRAVQGTNQSGAGGLNLMYNKSQLNRYFVSYLGNTNKKELEQETSTENFVPQGTYLQQSMLDEVDKSTPHNVNFGFRHTFSKTNRLTMDGNLSFEDGNLNSLSEVFSGIEDSLINSLNNTTNSYSDLMNFDVGLTHIAKFNEDKTQLKTDFSSYVTKNSEQLDWLNITTLYSPPDTLVLDQFRMNDLNKSNWTLTPTWVQKAGQNWTSELGAAVGITTENLTRREGLLNTSSEVEEFAIPSFKVSNNFIRPSLSFRRAANNSNLSLSAAVLMSRFDKTLTDSLGISSLTQDTYSIFVPSIRYRNDYRSGRRVELAYFKNVNMPTANQLYPVPNTLNILSIYQGNIDLQPEKNHTAQITWSIFDEFSFTSLFIRLMGRYTEDKISLSQTINQDLVQLIQPINVKDNLLFNSKVDFTKPWKALGVNFNLSWIENWNQGIVFTNTAENTNTVWTHTVDIGFENRSKSKLGYQIGGSIAYSNSQFSVDEDRNNNYWNTVYYATLRYNPSRKWYFEAKANVTSFNADNYGDAVEIPLITGRVSYSFLQAEKASVSLVGFDLLNKYIGFQQLSTGNYLQEKEWNTIGRYVMLSLSYQFR